MSDLTEKLLYLDPNITNNSTKARSDWEYYPLWFHIFLWLVMVVLSAETIIGNLMVLLAYKLDRQIQKHLRDHSYITSDFETSSIQVFVEKGDLIIGLEGFPLLTVYVVQGQRWPLGHILCQVWLCLDYTLCLVSILTVLLITVDRYGSVCYPALYIKWQSENKTHWLISFSWIIPAIFFSIMIFGWTAFTGEAVSDPTKGACHKLRQILKHHLSEFSSKKECYAPFLNDPYVNMSMYIVYYWTTLFAMLILYRGIHKTAKSLEKRGEQREKQSLALLMGQRCMAQVGVGLLIRSQVVTETKGFSVNTSGLPGNSLSLVRAREEISDGRAMATEREAHRSHSPAIRNFLPGSYERERVIQVRSVLALRNLWNIPKPADVENDLVTCGVTLPAVDSGYGTTAAPPTLNNVDPLNLNQQQQSGGSPTSVKRAPLLLGHLNQNSIGSLDPYDNVSLMSGFGDLSTSSVLALKFDPSPVPPDLRKKTSTSGGESFFRNGSCKFSLQRRKGSFVNYVSF